MNETDCRLTEAEINAVRSSWKALTANGVKNAGQLILHRLFNDVVEVRPLFDHFGISQNITTAISMEELKKNSKFNSHALRLSSNITKLLEHTDDLDTFSNMCVALGQRHVQYKVKPRHFDALAGVLVNVVTTQMNIEMSHPIVQAWIKIYGLMLKSIKVGLKSV